MTTLPKIGADSQRILRGSVWFTPRGEAYGKNLGSAKIEFEAEIEHTDIFSNEFKLRNRLRRIITQTNGSLKLTLKSFVPMVMALAHMSKTGLVLTQVATASLVKVYEDVSPGDTVALRDANGKRVYGVAVTSIDPAGAADVDTAAGRVTFKTEAAEVTVTVSVPAITADQGKTFLQFLAEGQIDGSLELRQDNALGDNYDYEWPDVSIALSGGMPMIADGNDVAEVELTVTINADVTKPQGLERGSAVQL